MSDAAFFRVLGDRPVIQALANIAGPNLRRATLAAARQTMKPTMADAKANAPAHTGRLRASLKIHTLQRLSGDQTGVAIYPANDFVFRHEGQRILVGRSKRTIKKAIKRGLQIDTLSVWSYAHIIETGHTRKGVSRMRPQWFLRRALESNAARMQADFGRAILAHVEANKAKT